MAEQLDYRGKPRKDYQTFNDMPSETVQSEAHLADIQHILGKYREVGIQKLDEVELRFADVSEFTDYADLMRQVKVAEVEFMKLPSKVREIFGHDVANWLDAAHDPEKRDALVEAGFIEAPEEVVEDPPTAASEPVPEEESSA